MRIIRRTADANSMLPGHDALLSRIYRSRGVQSADELNLSLKQLLPFQQLKGIDEAVTLLSEALNKQARVLIVGDFDADGATASALGKLALTEMGFKNISYLVPNRFEFGYGLTPKIVDVAIKKKPQLLITVDNGISSHAGVTHAKSLGLKVIITDHHLPGKTLPTADAIVNPNQPLDEFPSKNLSGVGVMFYLMAALRHRLREKNIKEAIACSLADYLDLVALGTVADVVKLDFNNRILVEQGLRRIRSGHCRPGIKALLDIAGREVERVTASDIGYVVGPRLNAAGRLTDISLGISCLLTEDPLQAQAIARQLDNLNQQRRDIEASMVDEADQILQYMTDQRDLPYGICLYQPGWHQGIVGILASRVREKTNRPVIVFSDDTDGMLKGSGRSCARVHMRDALDRIATFNPDVLQQFGGHAGAAGLKIKQQHLAQFGKLFNQHVAELLTTQDLENEILSDGAIAPSEMNLKTANRIKFGGPWGCGFDEPLFDDMFLIKNQYIIGKKHLKLKLKPSKFDMLLDAIAFNHDLIFDENYINAAYRLDINYYRGDPKMQLIVQHIVT